ncbi:hypothetical protein S40285_06731 [Stachybotrys chlorohalonatus IBT 40285]|uniref:Major facilitator superfamily transporter n=1 Tax=Stachybotrys chlorohalonatus (strain IBT 40285) TaxID=1283841 RepID=A0A084QJD2_STAC4|nr:hypothetical protein S40285_06731 [Stachybotrys chlorohalonata IBT 40285]
MKSLLGHSLYRRVLAWTMLSLALGAIVLLRNREGPMYSVDSHTYSSTEPSAIPTASLWDEHTATESSPSDAWDPQVVVNGGNAENKDIDPSEEGLQPKQDEAIPYEQSNQAHLAQKLQQQQQELQQPIDEPIEEMDEESRKLYEEEAERTPWLRFKHLDGYFFGLKTLVKLGLHRPEYPDPNRHDPIAPPPVNTKTPKPKPYNPYKTGRGVKTCYLDAAKKIAAPDVYAYEGVPQHMPDPSIGSYELLGLRNDVCFDRFGRYGPYGLGYNKSEGGTGIGLDTEDSHSDEVWKRTGRINYVGMDWAAAQESCYETNKHRFLQLDLDTFELEAADHKKGRMAVVVRLYTGFTWNDHVILNFRALINELALKSGGEYDVHFLMHVRDNDLPIWADNLTVQRLLVTNVPPEFRNMVTLWSEAQMKLVYPGRFDEPVSNPSGQDIHGVYRSAHLPLQVFASKHPEYEHIWNWEMDMRYIGNYYELFDRMGKWAGEQPRPLLWERNERYYIPSHHGSWENFTTVVQQHSIESGRTTVFGPMSFPGLKPLQKVQKGKHILPHTCDSGMDRASCGVGEPADLITLNPIFDADESGWIFGLDVTGYGPSPPRRCAIITASRLSRRLLMAMHEEVWRNHHSMFSEMFPASVALHHGFKAVYAPHPVFLDRAWNPPSKIDAAFNGGRDHSASGDGSPYDLRNEHNHKGTSWYYHSEFAGLLWRRWLGYAQFDGRGVNGGRANEGTQRGGKEEETAEESTGRLCLRSMLAHPIKYEHPNERR